jgi:hypothetical protein
MTPSLNAFMGVFARGYLEWQLMAFLASFAFSAMGPRLRPWLRFQDQQRFARALLVLSIAIPFLVKVFPYRAPFMAPVQVWSGEISTPSHALHSSLLVYSDARVEVFGLRNFGFHDPVHALTEIFIGLFVLGLARFLFVIARDRIKLGKIMARSYRLRKIGRVELWTSEKVGVPLSFHIYGRAMLLLPFDLCADRQNWRAALAHELQHHRQHDTRWVYIFELLKGLAWWNPLFCRRLRKLEEVQEMACDEALLERNRVSPQNYARCLLELAQRKLEFDHVLAGTAGMSSNSADVLKGRIQMTITRHKSTSRWLPHLALAICTGLLSAMSMAERGLVRDRRIDDAQVRELVRSTNARSHIHVNFTPEVLDQLNRSVGTPQGREFMRAALERMKNYRPMIESKLRAAKLPVELLATPIHESGYRNRNNGRGAGLWAFIAQTARKYGLRVDSRVDERLDPQRLSDAAVDYYTYLYGVFGDWSLALLAYNAGEGAVISAMRELSTRDPWKIVRESRSLSQENRDYLAMAMVSIIVLENPQLLD